MLFGVVGVALVGAGLCVAWLVPKNVGPAFATFPAELLEVNVPQFFRPFDMGTDPGERGLGMWLVRQPSGEVRAFWSRDPHSGSTTRPETFEGRAGFRAVDTGSFFSLDGARLAGPAPRGLDRFEVRQDADLLTIDVTHVILGTCSASPWTDCSPPGAPQEQEMRWPRA